MKAETSPVYFFKDLADDTRLKIILMLMLEQELCVCELTFALDLSQPKISRHMAQLKAHDLVEERKVGRWVFYRLSADMLAWQYETIKQCLTNNSNFIVSFRLTLDQMGDRPNRQQACCE
ncbi:MAG: ArsR family transcriptional regulator [Alteromonadaceae bacterium]